MQDIPLPEMDRQILQAVAEHIVLPPVLPQQAPEEDEQLRAIERAICQLAVTSSDTFAAEEPAANGLWGRIIGAICKLGDMVESPLLIRDYVLQQLQSMSTSDIAVFHIRRQNAAVIVRRYSEHSTFECFEVQTPTASVMECSGKLLRTFPESAVRVPNTTMDEHGFLDQVATLFVNMDNTLFDDAVPKTRKAGTDHDEIRDAVHPMYISEMLMAILLAHGSPEQVRTVDKRVADDVLWKDAYAPWRRSPVWLILRVLLQTTLNPTTYKTFMIHLHATLLQQCINGDLESELLYVVRAKMARRAHKLAENGIQNSVLERALAVAHQAEECLQSRWTEVLKEDAKVDGMEWQPSSLDIESDTAQTLPHCGQYIRNLLQQSPSASPSELFVPPSVTRIQSQSFADYAGGKLEMVASIKNWEHIVLYDFEHAVRQCLGQWVSQQNNEQTHEAACLILQSCIVQYSKAAMKTYSHDPAELSIFALTVVELWVAMDQLAIASIPLLANYSPEIPQDFLQPLLLRTRTDYNRANEIELYLADRHGRAHSGSVFSDDMDSLSFALCYYASSAALQDLKSQIETEAQNDRNSKISELQDKNAKHQRLLSQAAARSHQYLYWNSETHSHEHKFWSCEKCSLESQAASIAKAGIIVHEWPLPTNELQARRVVFELKAPHTFQLWRSATYAVINDLGLPSRSESVQPPELHLQNYDALQRYSDILDTNRVSISSTTKSFLQAHYSRLNIPTTESQVCVPNGCRYQIYDQPSATWATTAGLQPSTSSYGTLKLPAKSPYSYLQYAVDDTTHTTNRVIADRCDCPQDLTLQEHDSFGSLRSGGRLQWLNILRELEDSSLTLRAEAVYIVVSQATWQIGKISEDYTERIWHEHLGDASFGYQLLDTCQRVLNAIRVNWLESVTLKLLVTLVCRLLSYTPDKQTPLLRQTAFLLLKQARSVAFDWLHDVEAAAQASLTGEAEEGMRTRWHDLICEMAIICRMTYDLDQEDLSSVMQTQEDIHVYLISAIALHDNQPALLHNTDRTSTLTTLITRDQRVAHKLHGALTALIKDQHRQGFFDAMKARWLDFCPSEDVQTSPCKQWVFVATARQDQHSAQALHLNLLSGLLLIDGQPLGRLPRAYTSHPLYLRTFGNQIMNVLPGTGEMKYATTTVQTGGYMLYFSLEGTNLRIQANKDGKLMELIPDVLFDGDFPRILKDDYAHWLDFENARVEFRPLYDQWRCSPQDWHLDFQLDLPVASRKWNTHRHLLLDFHSTTSRMVTSHLSRLEDPLDVVIWLDEYNDVAQVNLPRLHLDFVIFNEHLMSTTFPGLVVDNDQTCGTFVGLHSRLLLRADRDPSSYAGFRRRSVIIPHGEIHISRKQHHVCVNIRNSDASSVSYSKFDVNQDLGRIEGASTLIDRLLKVYLHAITSCCSSDPLTGRMGVEQALSDFTCGALLSFTQLDKNEANLLAQIATLTPVRKYYPDHLRCMQSIEWSNISAFAQHPAFALLARTLFTHADSMSNLVCTTISHKEALKTTAREQVLSARAHARTSWIYAASYREYSKSVEESLAVCDQNYICRSVTSGPSEDLRAVWKAVRTVMAKNPTHVFDLSQWLLQECPSSMTGPTPNAMSLGFDSPWLKPDLARDWLSMYELCRKSLRDGSFGHYQLAFSLAALAYRSPKLRCLISVLSAIASNPAIQVVDPPEWKSYSFTHGFQRKQSVVEDLLRKHQQVVSQSPSGNISQQSDESLAQYHQRQRAHHQEAVRSKVPDLAAFLLAESPPIRVPQDRYTAYHSWFHVERVEAEVSRYFTHCAHNNDLKMHLELVDRHINTHAWSTTNEIQADTLETIFLATSDSQRTCRESKSVGHLRKALSHGALLSPAISSGTTPGQSNLDLSPFMSPLLGNGHLRNATNILQDLAERLGNDSNDCIRRLYGKDLQCSVSALQNSDSVKYSETLLSAGRRHELRSHILDQCETLERDWRTKTGALQTHCAISDPILHDLLQTSGLSPRQNALDFIQLLSLQHRRWIGADTLALIMELCRAFVLYQHTQRLLSLSHSEMSDIMKEYQYWRTTFDGETPDHLLLQIDGNFRIRPQQLEVAHEMKAPSLKQAGSAVEQLNMGEGKSSVITPMVVADLADGYKLVRLVVLKALSGQMHALLVNRLGGLVNRRVFYLPFHRQLDLRGNNLQLIENLLQECACVGGVLLAQPEHILSMKLMSVDLRLNAIHNPEQLPIAERVMAIQTWVDANCRQLLDESDELLHVQYQLVYTFGDQQPLDDSPDRWVTIMDMLNLVTQSDTLPRLMEDFPGCIQYNQRGHGRFPLLRLLRNPEHEDEVWSALTQDLAHAVLAGRVQNINLTHISSDNDIRLLTQFFTTQDISDQVLLEVERLCQGSWKAALLVRGLLACNVLRHVLADKRHRVNYGLDLKRSLLAVPYSAKDVPTIRSEFSHPDVCIALTALSYAYTGLDEKQLMQCFDILARSDDPNSEYQLWTQQNPKIDKHLRQLSGVNTKDLNQFRKLVLPALADNQATIRFFVTHMVFPKEAREFPYKLSASGWDLAEERPFITTGFSGTNDRKYLLPTSIQQHDLPEQLKTNALVMSYLLQPENQGYHIMPKQATKQCRSTEVFLDRLVRKHPDVRVLLDIGAQMLEMQNHDLVEYWLVHANPDPDTISAGVYFNKHDELVVLTRDGSVQVYESSPYKYTMDKVLVYLDDAHTRGTDLKFPRNMTAAATLGPQTTKDRLVQGCMRMRQLGHGQSIVFFAPPECDSLIRAAAGGSDHLTSRDILRWVMQETCDQLHHYIPHWAQQGLLHSRHQIGERSFGESGDAIVLQEAWRTREGRTLAEMYGRQDKTMNLLHEAQGNEDMAMRLRTLDVVTMNDPHLDEEQERELSHEVEKEQQIERPPKAIPVDPVVHPDLLQFVKQGHIPQSSLQFPSLMRAVNLKGQDQGVWAAQLRGTSQFFKAVKGSEDANRTIYARPFRWMITSSTEEDMVIVAVSPFEANELLPTIRQYGKVHLHIYTPRVVQSMRSFSDLRFHVIPALPSEWSPPSAGIQSQFNLFAGQLYFNSYQSYFKLCAFLGLLSLESSRLYDRNCIERDSSGFISPDLRTMTPDLKEALSEFHQQSFGHNIVANLKEHISLRRNGVDFFRTHVGQLLHGRQLSLRDIEPEGEDEDGVNLLQSRVATLRL